MRMADFANQPVRASFDTRAPKRATNLSINADLLSKARELEINLSATLEQALADARRREERARWLKENRKSMDAYNAHVQAHGVFGDGLRSF